MSKGNQVPVPVIKETKIPDFDAEFEKAKSPLTDVANWNNTLDKMMGQFRSVGKDIRATSDEEPRKSKGTVQLAVDGDNVHLHIVDESGAEVDAKTLGVAKENKKIVEKKCKKVHSRLVAIKKVEGCEDAVYTVEEKEGEVPQIRLNISTEARDKHGSDDKLVDLERSLMKLNNRVVILQEALDGAPTLAETVSALFHSVKNTLAEKQKSISMAISNGFPEITIGDGKEKKPIHEMDLSDLLPALLQKAWKLFMSLLDYIKELMEGIPGLVDKIKELFESAQSFPGKLKDAASSLNMGPAEMMKTGKILKGNVNELKNAPTILAKLGTTCQDAALQIANSAQDALGGDKAE